MADNLFTYSNTNGLLYKVAINNACISCGSCIGLNSMFLETSDGKPSLKNGGLLKKCEVTAIEDVKNICPTNAITLMSVSVMGSEVKPNIENIKKVISEKLANYQFPKPQYKDFVFDLYVGTQYNMLHSSRAIYSSEYSAESAGAEVLDANYFNCKSAICTKVLSEYKNSTLKPLICYEQKAGNYYYDEQERINAFLYAILCEVEALTNRTFTDAEKLFTVSFNIKEQSSFSDFEKNEYHLTEYVESREWYKDFIRTDCYEQIEDGIIFKGLTRTVKKYSFDVNKAITLIEEHINKYSENNVGTAFDVAVDCDECLYEKLSKKVQNAAKIILEFIDNDFCLSGAINAKAEVEEQSDDPNMRLIKGMEASFAGVRKLMSYIGTATGDDDEDEDE